MLKFEKLQNRWRGRTLGAVLPVMAVVGAVSLLSIGASGADRSFDYRMLATSKTSTMDNELNEAAAAGYRFSRVMAGQATNGGQLIIAMVKEAAVPGRGTPKYKLLATTKTSTMQAEIQREADRGYSYLDHTVFESAAGRKELVVIMEIESSKDQGPRSTYRLLATTRTSTMEKELQDAGGQGFALLGFSAGKTAGGNDVIAILRKDK